MIDRSSALLDTIRLDKEGHIRDYKHDYKAGFCLGWINAAMVFMNFRDNNGAEMLGVMPALRYAQQDGDRHLPRVRQAPRRRSEV